MPFTIRRAGHVVLRMQDHLLARDFFEEVVGLQTAGLEGDGMFYFLTANPLSNHHMIGLRGGAGKRLPDPDRQLGMISIAYEMTDPEELGRLAGCIADGGGRYGVTILQPVARGDRDVEAFVCADKDGNRFEFFSASSPDGRRRLAPGVKVGIRRTSHLNVRCRDLVTSRSFYEGVLHLFPVAEGPNGRMYFSGDPATQLPVLSLQQARERDVPVPQPREMYGLEHFSMEVGSFDQLRDAYAELKRNGVRVHHTIDHGVTQSVYFLDPDGNLLEIYHDVPRAEYRNPENPWGLYGTLEERLEATTTAPA